LVSAISPAATTARPRHGAVKQQLSIKAKPHQKHAAGCWESTGNGRAVVARAGPGPLTEIEPDLQEDPIDRWRTNGVSPVCRWPRLLWDMCDFPFAEAFDLVSCWCCLKKSLTLE
jgi:hypothetical protein